MPENELIVITFLAKWMLDFKRSKCITYPVLLDQLSAFVFDHDVSNNSSVDGARMHVVRPLEEAVGAEAMLAHVGHAHQLVAEAREADGAAVVGGRGGRVRRRGRDHASATAAAGFHRTVVVIVIGLENTANPAWAGFGRAKLLIFFGLDNFALSRPTDCKRAVVVVVGLGAVRGTCRGAAAAFEEQALVFILRFAVEVAVAAVAFVLLARVLVVRLLRGSVDEAVTVLALILIFVLANVLNFGLFFTVTDQIRV
jgi:hypothetical protein